MQWLSFTFAIIAHAVLIFCVAGIVWGAGIKRMPLFLAYLVFEELVFAVLLATVLLQLRSGGANVLYSWVEVVGSVGISSCLQLAVFYEIVSTLILPRSPALTALRPLIRWTMASAILLAVGISAMFSGVTLRPLTHIFEVLNFSTNLINLGLLLGLLAFTKTFNISWKSLPAGVALGFGITSSTEMGATSFISALGVRGIIPSDVVRTLGFLACTLVWLVYVFLPKTEPRFTGQGLQKSEIEIWDQELGKMVPR